MAKRLTMEDRRRIAEMYSREASTLEIAFTLNFHPATIYDELKRGSTGKLDANKRPEYDPERGQEVYQENMRRIGRMRAESKRGVK